MSNLYVIRYHPDDVDENVLYCIAVKLTPAAAVAVLLMTYTPDNPVVPLVWDVMMLPAGKLDATIYTPGNSVPAVTALPVARVPVPDAQGLVLHPVKDVAVVPVYCIYCAPLVDTTVIVPAEG